MIKIGCCGFPKGRATYFKYFKCVELQNTFYQPPKNLSTLKKLKEEAPLDFEFLIKAWQIITHPASLPTYRRLKEEVGDRDNYGFFKPTEEVFFAYKKVYDIAKILGARIILFQTPPNFKDTPENINNMYSFFRKIERTDLILCWEERSNFKELRIKKICRDLDLVHTVDPFKKTPLSEKLLYFRLHGRGGYRYRYTKKDLEYLKTLVEGKKGYVLFNNVYMWEDALNFQKLIRR